MQIQFIQIFKGSTNSLTWVEIKKNATKNTNLTSEMHEKNAQIVVGDSAPRTNSKKS